MNKEDIRFAILKLIIENGATNKYVSAQDIEDPLPLAAKYYKWVMSTGKK